MRRLSNLIALSVLLLVCSTASAGIRPSFLPEVCSWRATDIVVVTEGQEIDGVFKILETLKGDLKPGGTIEIPELKQFKSKEARTISDWWHEKPSAEATFVTGEKMILFLRDARKLAANPDDDDDELNKESKPNTARWQSANLMADEPQYSTVWIEKGQVYCFIQQMNPGPSLLSKSSMTETGLRNEVADVGSTQETLNGAIVIPDAGRRAESLKPFLHHRIYLAHEKAFAELVRCGEAALPVLRAVLHDDSLVGIHSEAIDAMEAVGGRTIGPELTALVEREFQFWRRTGPALKPGWWHGEGLDSMDAAGPLNNRWGIINRALLALKDIRYAGCKRAVIEFTELLRSIPQLYDSHTSQACDELLRALARKNERPPARIPPYEIRFTGNKVFSTQVLEAKFAEGLAAYPRRQRSFDGDMFHYALEKLGDFISSQGYAQAGQGSSFGTNERGVWLTVDIREGTRYRLGTIKIEGNRVFSTEQIRAMLNIRSGDLCDFTAISKWLFEDLQQAYRDRGHLQYDAEEDSNFRPPNQEDNSGIADYKITINEGPRFKVHSIAFEGKSEIPETKLRGSLKLVEGSIYSQAQFQASLDAINELGLQVDSEEDIRFDLNETQHLVNIVITLDKRTSRQRSGRSQLEKRVRRIFN